jgi:hypothetical protein
MEKELRENHEVNRDVTVGQLKKAGFKEKDTYWSLNKWLIEDYVKLIVMIAKADLYCVEHVIDETRNTYYAPFYNPMFRVRNKVCEKVEEEYVRIIEKLRKQGVFV